MVVRFHHGVPFFMKSYSFYIAFEKKQYIVFVNDGSLSIESVGPSILDEPNFDKLKRYLKLEGFLDSNINYTIM